MYDLDLTYPLYPDYPSRNRGAPPLGFSLPFSLLFFPRAFKENNRVMHYIFAHLLSPPPY